MVGCSFSVDDDRAKMVTWIGQQFSNHRLFRRALLLYACVMVWITTHWSFQYAHASELDGLGIAAVITAIQTPVTALMGYLVKLYTTSITKD